MCWKHVRVSEPEWTEQGVRHIGLQYRKFLDFSYRFCWEGNRFE